eukprot:Opistho-2@42303
MHALKTRITPILVLTPCAKMEKVDHERLRIFVRREYSAILRANPVYQTSPPKPSSAWIADHVLPAITTVLSKIPSNEVAEHVRTVVYNKYVYSKDREQKKSKATLRYHKIKAAMAHTHDSSAIESSKPTEQNVQTITSTSTSMDKGDDSISPAVSFSASLDVGTHSQATHCGDKEISTFLDKGNDSILPAVSFSASLDVERTHSQATHLCGNTEISTFLDKGNDSILPAVSFSASLDVGLTHSQATHLCGDKEFSTFLYNGTHSQLSLNTLL